MDLVDQRGRELETPPPLWGTALHATAARLGITLDPRVLLGEDVKNEARCWTCATLRKFLREFVARDDPSSFPFQEAGDAWARMCEGSVGCCWRWQGRW